MKRKNYQICRKGKGEGLDYFLLILDVFVLSDLVSMGTTWVWVMFHSDKFDGNGVKPA